MDYPLVNISSDRDKQGLYWTTRPGPYDVWAIQFAYQPRSSQAETDALLARSTEPQLTFGNDADDMRYPGKAIDPRVNVNDLTSDAIEYGIDRMELSKTVMTKLLERAKKEQQGQSYHQTRTSYAVLMGQYAGAGNIISRYIGGVYVDRAFIGQKGGTQPFTPVEYEKQKQAMNALSKYVFAPDAFGGSNELYNYLQQQRRGFGFFAAGEDPKIHQRVIVAQVRVLGHLLHPNTLNRISDSELYGNKYGLSEMMTDLNNAIFKADIAGSVNGFRQNLQVAYTCLLYTSPSPRD